MTGNKKLLLGLGIGLIISSTIFYVGFISVTKPSLNDNKIVKIDDNEIIERAKGLGMISLADIPTTEKETLSDNDIISKAEKLGMIFKPEEITETESTETDSTEIETVTETKAEIIDVRIEPGSSSIKIATVLYDLGLVDNLDEFIKYMDQSGKSNILRAGYFKIVEGSDYQQILKILTTPPSQ